MRHFDLSHSSIGKILRSLTAWGLCAVFAQTTFAFGSTSPQLKGDTLLTIPPLTLGSAQFLNGQNIGSITEAPSRTDWTLEEQNELCQQIDSGDAAALGTLREMVGKRVIWAQRIMAQYYMKSSVVGRDTTRALELYRAAAERGDVSSQEVLGWIYFRGDGVPKDYEQAQHWFNKAANQGDNSAQTKLGEMLRDGQGGEPNSSFANSFFSSAAAGGDKRAALDLAAAYANGQGFPADMVQAYKWLIVASEYSRGAFKELTDSAMETVGKKMSPQQIEEAKNMAAAWKSAHPTMVLQLPPNRVEADFDPAQPCHRPTYPVDAAMRRQTGKVRIKLTIDANGAVASGAVINSSGFPSLDQAAFDSFSKCAYLPAMRQGLPIEGTKYIEYTWSQ